MMSHLYALSMFFVILHHVSYGSIWVPAIPRLFFLVHEVSEPMAIPIFTFLGGLQDHRHPPTTVRGMLRKLALNLLLGIVPNVFYRLVTGYWLNKLM